MMDRVFGLQDNRTGDIQKYINLCLRIDSYTFKKINKYILANGDY